MSSLPSPVCLACHREGRDDKLPLSDVARHESDEGGCLGDKQEKIHLAPGVSVSSHREEFESLKWLSATYLVKVLGISKFTPAAVLVPDTSLFKPLRVRKE